MHTFISTSAKFLSALKSLAYIPCHKRNFQPMYVYPLSPTELEKIYSQINRHMIYTAACSLREERAKFLALKVAHNTLKIT